MLTGEQVVIEYLETLPPGMRTAVADPEENEDYDDRFLNGEL